MKRILSAAIVFWAAWAQRGPADAATNLAQQFLEPPADARPWVYWFFMDGNMTREGMTADLEAMARAGIGGAIMMEVNVGIPRGPVEFMSDAWRANFKHAVIEAERLGIQLTLNAGPGWTGSGGPWVPPEQSMQHLVASETRIVGPRRFNDVLPQPPPRPPYFSNAVLPEALEAAKNQFYRDFCVLAFPTTAATNRIEDIDEKALYLRHPYTSRPGTKPFHPAPSSFAEPPKEAAIPAGGVIDITSNLDPNGRLVWDVPTGDWTVLRFGRTSTGANTRPAPTPGLGLECDKFSRTALDAHFNAFVGALLKEIGPRQKSSGGWKMLHIDSWEMGAQNWSDNFYDEFKRRRGYDPKPKLPALTGRITESAEISERFLWNLRLTAQELVIENHARHLKGLAAANGLGLSIEPYDMNPCADLSLGAVADVPMCEFWLHGYDASFSVIEASSIAHTCGLPVVAAEAFTSTAAERWQAHPATMKALGDWALCAGVNRIVFHRYQHQPWLHLRPGMTMGPYGVHWERTQTWWELVPAYHRYLSRCQFMLRRGLPVADVLFLSAEGAPHVFRPPSGAVHGSPPDRARYNFDGCSPETLLARVSVRDGMLVLPDGMSYRLMVLPERETMTPALLGRIRDLVRDGAVVVGPPPVKSPSLSNHPRCDEEVRSIATEVWGACDGISLKEHACGKGRVAWESTHQIDPEKPPPNPLADARWIWHKADLPLHQVPVGKRSFRRVLTIRARASIQNARIFMAADNAFALKINGRPAGEGSDFHRLREFDVAHMLGHGSNMVSVAAENGGSSPNPAGLIGAIVIKFNDGSTQTVPTDHEWLSADTTQDAPWVPAAELGPSSMAPWKLDGRPPPPEPEQYCDFRVVERQLGKMGIPPDFESDGPIRYAHRREGDADIYFVANRDANDIDATCRFRVTGRTPQLWDPLTGLRRRLPEFQSENGRTAVPLRFAPHQSWFVVFADNVTERHSGNSSAAPALRWRISGPWLVTFEGGQTRSTFKTLQDWTKSREERVRHYSGVATYATSFRKPKKASNRKTYLDLGVVHSMARVRLNGIDVGTVWCAPWRVDITAAMTNASNRLEIDVANLWPNRLIGDERFPDDCTERSDWRAGSLPSWPAWLINGTSRPEPRRVTFATFKHWKANDELLPSGLLGPVTIVCE